MPRRGPEAGFHLMYYDFHGSAVNNIDSCPFLPEPKKYIIFSNLFGCVPFYHKLDNEEDHECNDHKINNRSYKIANKKFYRTYFKDCSSPASSW